MLSKATVKFVSALHRKKERNEQRLFIAEGEKIVDELLSSSFVIHSLFATDEWQRDTAHSVILVNDDELAKMSLLESSNKVLAVVQQPTLEKQAVLIKGRNYLVLDSIRDPGNLGTMLRIADWFGIDEVIASPGCVEVFNPKVVQASMGSVFRIPYTVASIGDLLQNNAIDKVPVYATGLAGKNIYEVGFNKGCVLIIGNESNGISIDLDKYVDETITIPTYNESANRAESLNAAIAAAVICAEMRRQQNT